MRTEHDAHDLESVYLTHMRAAREDGFAALVRHAFTTRRAKHLRTACWAAAQLAEQYAHHSRIQALAWARRCCQAYAEYNVAIVPGWVRSMAILAGVTLPTDMLLADTLHRAVQRQEPDPLYRTVQRIQRAWAEPPELSLG